MDDVHAFGNVVRNLYVATWDEDKEHPTEEAGHTLRQLKVEK